MIRTSFDHAKEGMLRAALAALVPMPSPATPEGSAGPGATGMPADLETRLKPGRASGRVCEARWRCEGLAVSQLVQRKLPARKATQLDPSMT